MDIDQLMYQAVSRDNDSNELKGFIQSQGARQSANEHLVPEQLFDDPNTKEKEVEGVSAVKAIQIAQEQGQTVYTITQDNYSQIIPKLSLSANVMTDIRDNVAVGRTVTVHEKTINYKGWKGSGYIIIDPQTGSGAYLIDGGANGGYAFIVLVGFLTFFISAYSLIVATFAITTFAGFVLSMTGAFLFYGGWRDYLDLVSKLPSMSKEQADRAINEEVAMLVIATFGGIVLPRVLADEDFLDTFMFVINDLVLGIIFSSLPYTGD